MSAASSTEQQRFSPQRVEDQQQEDLPSSFSLLKPTFDFNFLLTPIPNSKIINSNNINYNQTKFTWSSCAENDIAMYDYKDKMTTQITDKGFDFTNIKDWFFQKFLQNNSKTELFNRVMKLSSDTQSIDSVGVDELWESFQKHYPKTYEERKTQHGFAVVSMKNDGKCWVSEEVIPRHKNKKSNKSANTFTEHTEEILIQQVDEFLQNTRTQVKLIFIYTLNSPCLKRETKNIAPCMFQFLERAHQWHREYGIPTVVGFTKFWGLSGPNYFRDLLYSKISCPSSVFYPYIEKCKGIPFKLDCKPFREKNRKSNIYKTLLSVNETDRCKLQNDIKSAQCALMKLEGDYVVRKKHLDRVKEMIARFTFHPQVQDAICEILTDNMYEIVNNSSMIPIREKIVTDFNRAVVQLFGKQLKLIWGNSNMFKLVELPLNT